MCLIPSDEETIEFLRDCDHAWVRNKSGSLRIGSGVISHAVSIIDAKDAALRALLAERDELAKDAARYRLIRAGYVVLELLTPEARPEEDLNYRQVTLRAELNYGNPEEGAALDEFIDGRLALTNKD